MNTLAEHNRVVSNMFARIVRWYDPLNRLLSLGLDQGWRKSLASIALQKNDNAAPSTGRILDLAAGTLDVSIALQRVCPEKCVLAMDVCLPMLQQGKSKLHTPEARQHIVPATADACKLPLPDACVDAVTMAFGIRNITPRSEALHEMHRVLTHGGRVCLLEFGSGKQRIWKGLYNLYLTWILPLIGKLCSGDSAAYTYLAQTICDFPMPDELTKELHDAGFARVYHIPFTSGIVRLHVAEKA